MAAAASRKGRPSGEVLEWINQNKTLLRIVQNTEKQCSMSMLKYIDLDEIKEKYSQQERDRHDYINDVYKSLIRLKDISKQTHSLVETLTSQKEQKLEDAEKLQRMMERLQAGIVSFKSKMRKDFENTMTEERELSRDVMTVHERYILNPQMEEEEEEDDDDYLPVRKPKRKPSNGPVVETIASLRRDVESINKEIDEEGGMLGGWLPQEHEFFLALWTQVFGAHKGLPDQSTSSFRKALQMLRERGVSSVPSRTPDELERHALWYCGYIGRQEAKKQALDKWRKLRAQEEAAQIKELDEEIPKEKAPSKESRIVSQEKRRAVWEWKARKAQEAKLAEDKRLQDEAQAAAEEARKRSEQRSKQEAVALYKLEKEQKAFHEAQVKSALENSESSHRFSAAELRERRKIDVINAQRKRHEVLTKKQEKQRSQVIAAAGKKKREEVNEKVHRDPNRAMKSTQNSEHHAISGNDLDSIYEQRISRGAHGAPVAMGAYDLKWTGARAVPSWRKGMS